MLVNVSVDELLDQERIRASIEHIGRKKRCAGVDKIDSRDLYDYWEKNGATICLDIRKGRYHPAPFRKLRIPKSDGSGFRTLEIPCAVDRMLQYALHNLLNPHYDPTFSECSYGFRKGRSCIHAIEQGRKFIADGYDWILHLDIEGFFDNVNHSILMRQIEEEIQDKALVSLIRFYVQPRVMNGIHYYKKYAGLSQGSALSPLLSNIYLNRLDQYLEQNGWLFVRYADDVLVFIDGYLKASDALKKIRCFLNDELRLLLNQKKTMICKNYDTSFLGYSYTNSITNHSGIGITMSNKARKRLKDKMNKILLQKCGDHKNWWKRLGGLNRGWINYYKYADREDMVSFLTHIDDIQAEGVYQRLRSEPDGGKAFMAAFFKTRSYSSLMELYRGYIKHV